MFQKKNKETSPTSLENQEHSPFGNDMRSDFTHEVSNDELQSVSSITNSRVSAAPRRLEKYVQNNVQCNLAHFNIYRVVRDDNMELRSITSTSTGLSTTRGGSSGRQQAHELYSKSSTQTISSESTASRVSVGSSRFSKKMMNFMGPAPHLISLPMVQSLRDWLISNNYYDNEVRDDDWDASTGDGNDGASVMKTGATVARMKQLYGAIVELQDSINYDRQMLNPETSPEMIFFPIQNVISDVVVFSRARIQSSYYRLQDGAELLLEHLESQLKVLAEKRRHTQQLNSQIAVAERSLVRIDDERLQSLARLKDAKLKANELAKDMAFYYLATERDKLRVANSGPQDQQLQSTVAVQSQHNSDDSDSSRVVAEDESTRVDDSTCQNGEGGRVLFVSAHPKIGDVSRSAVSVTSQTQNRKDATDSVHDNDKAFARYDLSQTIDSYAAGDYSQSTYIADATSSLGLHLGATTTPASASVASLSLGQYLNFMSEHGKQRVEYLMAQFDDYKRSESLSTKPSSCDDKCDGTAVTVTAPKRKPPPRPANV